MLEQSQARLNRLAFVGYYLDSREDVGPHTRMNISDALKRKGDMDVSGLGSVHGSGSVRSTNPTGSTAPANQTAGKPSSGMSAPQDELQISTTGQMLDRTSETPAARAERIANIKDAIENGDYDTDEKLDAALSRMFEVHGFDLGDE